MKNILFIFCGILLSCNAQINKVTISDTLKTGRTVEHLGNSVMVFFEDKKGNQWFGSWETGLYQFNGSTITQYTVDDGLPSNRIDEIKEDANGIVYVNTSKGICRWINKRFQSINFLPLEQSKWELNAKDLWFKGQYGPVRFDGRYGHQLKLPGYPIGDKYVYEHPGYPDPYAIYTVYTDRNGFVWFGTATLGVMRYDGNTMDWLSESDLTEMHNGPSNGIRSIMEDEKGDFWFNSAYRYRVSRNQPFHYERMDNIGSLDGKSDGAITEYLSAIKTTNADLWFVTYNNGVFRFDGKTIRNYQLIDNGKSITAFAAFEDKKGGIWVTTHENGVFKWTGDGFERQLK